MATYRKLELDYIYVKFRSSNVHKYTSKNETSTGNNKLVLQKY